MKKTLLLLFLIFLTILSCTKEPIELKPINLLKDLSQIEIQEFDLDTLDYFKIKGGKGTEIFFLREDFDVEKGEIIIAELKEIYNFKELIFNNINTITESEELLESSGVIYIDFKVNGEKISLKDNKSIQINFPKNILKNNNVYYGKLNEFDQFKWIEEKQLDTLFSITVGGGIFNQIIISKDSIDYYKNYNLKNIGSETFDDYREALYGESDLLFNSTIPSFAIFKNLGWINIDAIVQPDSNLTFSLESKKEIDNLSFYFIYEDLNSFISDYRTKDSLIFKNIPLKNKTELIIVGKKDDKLFSDKILLNDIAPNSKTKIELKEITKEQINKLISK